jgi:GNAT superfamily N-acetyltransferase
MKIDISEGYQTGLIARITEMHAKFYALHWGFGRAFEVVVASGLADFASRLDHPLNNIWVATSGDKIVGSVAIDGEDMGAQVAHLRWFITEDAIRGTGAGRELLAKALAFVDAHGFAQTQLWTFKGLDAAKRLYEAHGFSCVEERMGAQWGQEVLEQRFARTRTS